MSVLSPGDRVRYDVLALPVADRLVRLLTDNGDFVCPHCNTKHPFLAGRPPADQAPGGFYCSHCNESTPLAAQPVETPADDAAATTWSALREP